jgi:methylglyoxal synthase
VQRLEEKAMAESPQAPKWGQRNSSDHHGLGLIASKECQPLLAKFLEEHAPTLRQYFLFVTWGTYYSTILDPEERNKLEPLVGQVDPLSIYKAAERWQSRLPWKSAGYSLRPGKRGGILQMAAHLEESAGTDRVRVLVFLTNPDDLEESYPEDRALFRSALRNNIIYLPNYRTASLWAAFESDNRPRSVSSLVASTHPEDEVLALIAHDRNKLDLCRWVVEYRERLRRFKRFITTGTTGGLVKDFLKAAGIPAHKIELVDCRESGPSGGDIEISEEIMRLGSGNVVFFVDPMTSHPHEADVQALLRICSMPDVEVNLRLTEAAATSWIKTIDALDSTQY